MTVIERVQDTYNRLDRRTLDDGLLGELYDPNVVFIDPLHRIEGLPALERYLKAMYRNVNEIRFHYQNQWDSDGQAALRWLMTLKHPKLNGGRTIELPGMTYLEYTDLITRHQDYFDSNQMVFDHLPVLGSLLGWLKGRLNPS